MRYVTVDYCDECPFLYNYDENKKEIVSAEYYKCIKQHLIGYKEDLFKNCPLPKDNNIKSCIITKKY